VTPAPAHGTWQPTLGACVTEGAVRFRVWAPAAAAVNLVLVGRDASPPMESEGGGYYSLEVAGVGAGQRYWYELDGTRRLPDPASRFQPEGVHGPSEVIDFRSYTWNDGAWTPPGLHQLVLYELHVGAFTPGGTLRDAAERLPHLARLGITAVELMPIAQFPGRRNWGYDGVDLFAPHRLYGRPDDLRGLVDAAHRLGLAVILDVVYNHLGPEGAYLSAYSPHYFTERHATPWGAALNLDGPESPHVRAFFVENARHWLAEYHVDGFRLDATHALMDEGPRHFVEELTTSIREAAPGALVIAEDERRMRRMVTPREAGGWGLDAMWADDFHHHMRRLLAGDHESYFARYSGELPDLARTVAQGWFVRERDDGGEEHAAATPSAEAPLAAYVICLQNHDQIGNRAFGERLHHQVDAPASRAATVVLLCAPETPLLFMGQEWAASTPFLYFTDHPEPLGHLVTIGRRQEFGAFTAFRDPAVRDRIPDPQAAETFEASRLDWSERDREPHAAALRLHVALLALRRAEAALHAPDGRVRVEAVDDDTLAFRREAADGRETVLIVSRLCGNGTATLGRQDGGLVTPGDRVETLLSTEDPAFAPDNRPIEVVESGEALSILFHRPGAIVLKRTDARRSAN
jgi:maltooligosyltrehalose trehalohydrolase